MATTTEKSPVLAPADKLKREVQAALTDDLVQPKYMDGFGKFDGHSYVASEAYWHLCGGKDSGLQPMQLNRDGKSHWWLVDPKGRVIDLTLGRGEKSDFPYEEGSARGFRYTPKGMSNRAATVVERVKDGRFPPF
jgi:hypothetical protein